MEEDIKFIKYYMKQYFYEDISIEDDFKFEEAIKNLLRRYNQLKEENEIYKEELKKIDKALNLEEGTAAPYRNDIIESLKRGIESLKKIIDNSIPKSKVKEKIEARESSIADIKDNFVINEGMTIEIKRLETEIDVLQELLEEE